MRTTVHRSIPLTLTFATCVAIMHILSGPSNKLFFSKLGGKPGGSCTAALFLKAFVDGIEAKEGEEQPTVQWAHLDIAGAMEVRDNTTSKFILESADMCERTAVHPISPIPRKGHDRSSCSVSLVPCSKGSACVIY